MSVNNDEDASAAAINQLLEQNEREVVEAERLQQAACPPNPDEDFANTLQDGDVRFELPAGL
jgi:hypothetical protein